MLEVFAPNTGVSPAPDVPPNQAGMRHVTFAVTELDQMITSLETAGVTIVERPRPAHNTELIKRVAFVRDPDGMMVELIERATTRAAP